MKHSLVYLPVEIKHRELDARVELARALCEAGSNVVIGQQWGLFANFRSLPTGAVLFKTVNLLQGKNMARWKKAGHFVVGMDEESLMADDETGFLCAVSPEAMENCDLFLAHRHAQAAAISGRYNVNTEVVGNGRVDACLGDSFVSEGDKIKSRLPAKSILVNTNYGVVNSIWGGVHGVADIYKQCGLLETEADREMLLKEAKWEGENMGNIIRFMREAHKEYRIVLRPHPMENADIYESLGTFGPPMQVLVIQGEHPLPWIYAAECLVHTSCTTGLEAALMGSPAINIQQHEQPRFKTVLDKVNPTVSTPKEALELLQVGFDMAPYTDRAREMFPAGCTEKTVEALSKNQIESEVDFTGYVKQDRTDMQRQKCTIEPHEIPGGEQIDDSLYLMRAA